MQSRKNYTDKTGQFVTIWKRDQQGVTVPFDVSNEFDLCIITTQSEGKRGLFVFLKEALSHHGVISDGAWGGKRGTRVYPAWDATTNKQTQKTQHWQDAFFLDFSQDNQFDRVRARCMLNLRSESSTLFVQDETLKQ